jgi:hypothetical protein
MKCPRDDTEQALGIRDGGAPSLGQDEKIVVGLGPGDSEEGEDAARAHAVVEVCEPRTVRENLRPQGHALARSVEQFVDAAGLRERSGQLIAKETNAEPVVQERVGRERRIQASPAQI